MRSSLIIAVLLFAGPAAAQDATDLARSPEYLHQRDMDRIRMDALRNELEAVRGQVRTEQTLNDLERRREPLRVQAIPVPPERAAPATARAARGGQGAYPSMSDKRLAESNARVRAIVAGRNR